METDLSFAKNLLPRPREITADKGEFRETDTSKRAYVVDASLPKEGYSLCISGNGIRIAAADDDGRFRADTTLNQLCQNGNIFPCCTIKDWPEFHYRGVLVDEGRHYYGVDGMKRLIDQMSQVKLNVFHWHFIENGSWDPGQRMNGWRIELPGYPKLTENTIKKYSRADLEEIVALAAERHVRVVPEIEMPGHNDAAWYYPELGHQGKGNGICVANDKAIKFFKDVIDYIVSIFPGAMVHFGGDEVDYTHWKTCPDCQAKMKELGLKTEAELQAWFMGKMAAYLKSKGKIALGWSDMLLQLTNKMHLNDQGYYTGYSIQKNLSKDVVVTAWYGDWECAGGSGAVAANLGYKTIQYPFNHCYFDYAQGIRGDTHRYNSGYGKTAFTLRDAYMWNPYADVKPECRENIVGIGCGNWSECAIDQESLEWKCWPRGFATAEIAWSCPKMNLNDDAVFDEFNTRAQNLGRRFREQGISAAYDSVGEYSADIVIYGSTPAAISAAVQAKRMGKSVIVVSPETRIGGLTTGGLGQTDIGNKKAFGGIALEFYRDVAKWYSNEKHWTYQKSTDYFPDGQCAGTKDGGSMWTFEPSAALAILEGWEKRDGLDIRRGERLDRSKGKVEVENGKIISFETESGCVYRGKMFVDATYEGDLMAASGVSYAVGRESNARYGETVNGCELDAQGTEHHNFSPWVSAYVKPGDKSSGLLPGIEPYVPHMRIGEGDRRVQAYCFRMCLTDVEENRIPFSKPANYDEREYELLFREYEAIAAHPEYKGGLGLLDAKHKRAPNIMSRMPNGKTDSNNCCGFSTDFIGRNWNWADGSYEEREKILKAHLDYQRGLMWTLANHPRIPADVREYYSKFGTCKDEFRDGLGGGWQRQLYVREARRMIGDYLMTERNCRGDEVSKRPVAMGAYTIDSHHVRRIETKDGYVLNEGNVEDGRIKGPYGIDYGAIIPRHRECTNLFVPVCLSATHVAFGSIRMEPVFFALGQVAGTAAAQSIDIGCDVQKLPYDILASRLLEDGQVIAFEPKREMLIAAANSPFEEQRAADIVCDGKNDERTINLAIKRMIFGGTIRLADGDYYIEDFSNEGNSAIFFGYNSGDARVITIKGTTQNKGYNTRHGVTLHVTKAAIDTMDAKQTYRVFYGTAKKPEAPGDFYTYTHVNNVCLENFFIFFDNATKPLIGIDGRNFGSMDLDQIGVYQKSYFNDRFMHIGAPDIPCDGTVGVYSVPGSNDEMSRCGYNTVNVGGLYRGFVIDGVDHLVMNVCATARCVYGYWFENGTPKTMTMVNCCDEGNTYLPRFRNYGHVTMIDFNIERFNEKFIPVDCNGDNPEHGAVEEIPGNWKGSISYTFQGKAYGMCESGCFTPGRFWAPGSGLEFMTRDLNKSIRN